MKERIRVLHVDDEPDFLATTAGFLESDESRFSVDGATSTEEALDLLSENEYDCVVSDYDMPNTDGIEFFKDVREEHPDLPFILFTGKGSEEVASDAVSAGVTDYLRKRSGPEQYELLANRVETAVEKRRAETNYRELFEKAHVGLTLHDPETGVFTDANRKFADLLGYEPEEIVGKHPDDISADESPFSREEADRLIRRAVEEGPQTFEWRNRTKDDEDVWVEVSLRRTRINGTPRVLAVVQDITERKEREKEIERYEAFVEESSEVIAHLDADGTMLYESPGTERVFGHEPEINLDENVFDYVHPDDRERVAEEFAEVLSDPERTVGEVELRLEDADGGYVWMEAAGADRTDTELGGVVVSLRDITERKKREKELEEKEAFIESSSDVITHVDVDGTILYQSPSVEDVLGHEPGERVGENAFEYAHPEDAERVAEKFFSLVDDPDKEAVEAELRYERADGGYVWIEAVGRDRTDTDLGGVIVNSRDITERKERERELERQNERLEEFASVVSHDLRNPLTVAKGRLELAQEECESEHLDEVDGALDRMSTLIDDILELAREGTEVGETEPLDLEGVAEECWHNVETDDANLVTEADADMTVEADRSRLKQLLENLIRNSVEHCGDGVTVEVGETDDGDGFYVADDGPGIPEKEHEKVFESGYSTSEEGGAGFGLSIVREIAEAHGWEVDVTESEWGGARFEFEGVEAAPRSESEG
jgi:PAS domain S-box-containing protein